MGMLTNKVIINRIFLAGLCIATLGFATLIPFVKDTVRRKLHLDERAVLSIVTGDLMKNGHPVKIIKVREEGSLFLEIFALNNLTHSFQLMQRIALGQEHDAFFNLHGKTTNLALDDVDGDSQSEIIVPTFDRNFLAQLSIFRYIEATNTFVQFK